MATPPTPPERSRWEEFAFAALANAAGTVLAVAVLYLAGVAAGIVRTNARTLAGAAPVIAVFLLLTSLLLPASGRVPPPARLWPRPMPQQRPRGHARRRGADRT